MNRTCEPLEITFTVSLNTFFSIDFPEYQNEKIEKIAKKQYIKYTTPKWRKDCKTYEAEDLKKKKKEIKELEMNVKRKRNNNTVKKRETRNGRTKVI